MRDVLAGSDEMMVWLSGRGEAMASRVEAWCGIASGSAYAAGLERMTAAVEPALEEVVGASGGPGTVERVGLPAVEAVGDDGVLRSSASSDALVARVRGDALTQVLLSIHLDTVYGEGASFGRVRRVEDAAFGAAMNGPGVADAKGGLVLMLEALRGFELHATSAMKAGLGWTVVLNPDEETGSRGSRGLLNGEAARVARAAGGGWGMVFEPALPNGDLIGARKGSGNFAVVVSGKAAHAGREFFAGRNAVVAAAGLATRLAGLTDEATGTTVNVGRIAGGGANNVVPDLAVVRFNVRVSDAAGQAAAAASLSGLVSEVAEADGIDAVLHGGFNNPPKALDAGSSAMLSALAEVGSSSGVGVGFEVQSSGGVCDGNKLAACGLAVVDTLGPVGRDIHSDRETLCLGSLVPRAKLSAGFLWGLGLGVWG